MINFTRKNMQRFLILLFTSLAIASPWAQTPIENIPLVTVVGEAKINVQPDVIVIRVNASRYLATSDFMAINVKQKILVQMKFVEGEHVTIKDDVEHIRKDDKGFLFVQDFTISITDRKVFYDVITKLHQNGFYNYKIVDFQVSNLEARKEQARIEAVKNAQKKAAALTKVLEQTLGKAHRIEEIEMSVNSPYPSEITQNTIANWVPLNDRYPIDFGYVAVIAKVKVSFDLKK